MGVVHTDISVGRAVCMAARHVEAELGKENCSRRRGGGEEKGGEQSTEQKGRRGERLTSLSGWGYI